MAENDPTKNPLQWFAHFCLVLLFGSIALAVAIDILKTLWPWLLGIGLFALILALVVAVWRSKRQPW